MPNLTRRALGALILTLPATAFAHHDVTAGDIAIGHPWTRAAGANANGAGFMTLKNNGAAGDRLISATSPAARVVELHTHIREGDVMRMRAIASLPLPAGQAVELKPGGYHLMRMDLKTPLKADTRVPLTLVLRDAKGTERRVELQVPVATRAPASR